MTREEMMMNMIMELGHEHENTIKFCQIAEGKNIPDNIVEEAYEVLLTNV
jgi:hypothetical protein